MTPAEVRGFLEEGRILQVASLHPDGRPHLVPMWYVMEEGQVVFRSFTRSQKIRNLRRDPRLSVLVERGEAYAELQGVMIQGQARLVDDPAYVLALYGKTGRQVPHGGRGAPGALPPGTGGRLRAARRQEHRGGRRGGAGGLVGPPQAGGRY